MASISPPELAFQIFSSSMAATQLSGFTVKWVICIAMDPLKKFIFIEYSLTCSRLQDLLWSCPNPPSLLVRVPSKFELDFAVAKQLNIQPFKKTRTFSLHNVQKPAIKRVHPFSS